MEDAELDILAVSVARAAREIITRDVTFFCKYSKIKITDMKDRLPNLAIRAKAIFVVESSLRTTEIFASGEIAGLDSEAQQRMPLLGMV